MDDQVQALIDALMSGDKHRRTEAYLQLLEMTKSPVPWAYETWDLFRILLTDKDNHLRTIGAQLLCNLAISDPEQRIMEDIAAIMEVTRDPMFVTARHTIQHLWRIGLGGAEQKRMLLDVVAHRFETCEGEKNYTLIRYDLLVGLRKLYDSYPDEEIRKLATELIELETDPKYKKKYAAEWRK
ncbi:hypothetical protein PAT3040_02158 [Paenibacillus agaridevorans]|uniref:HEAT repeat domain-containing protein n=1 Tax=Paenibacillus agaridevorans TaxID=171404 RepID=A0A2R5ELT9_9BACL|nr:hypothetical protein [Paenibacillus agaridevorans]GBG07602.1 hypothetical protein PAT3040_02158 [Paenibacillus agaridevorans]